MPPYLPPALFHPLAHRGRPEVLREMVDERRHHLFAGIFIAHSTAHALLRRQAEAAGLPLSPGGAAPDAGARAGLHEPAGNVAPDLGAHAALEFGEILETDIGLRLGIGDVSEE